MRKKGDLPARYGETGPAVPRVSPVPARPGSSVSVKLKSEGTSVPSAAEPRNPPREWGAHARFLPERGMQTSLLHCEGDSAAENGSGHRGPNYTFLHLRRIPPPPPMDWLFTSANGAVSCITAHGIRRFHAGRNYVRKVCMQHMFLSA